MSVTTDAGSRAPSRDAASVGPGGGLSGWLASTRASLERPLTPYYLLLGATGLLLAIGMIMVLSASSVDSFTHHDNSYYWATKQLMWVVVALPCAWIATRLPLRLLRFVSWPMVAVSLVLLVLTQTSLGVSVNGNQNWLGLGPLQIQPSEIAKFSMVLWCADVYARKDALLGSWRHLFIPVVPVTGLLTVLVLAGGDLGTALVLFAITLGLFWVVGVPARIFVAAVSVVSVAALYLAASSPERLNRITSFVNPFKDFQNSGWQAGHGILGMASGGILGKGIGASQQKWGNLPEAHTDFIFAVLGEELGLVGTLLVLALFLTIAYAGIRVAMQSEDLFIRYATAGIVIWLMAHVIINIGMVLALLPVIGIPLPLVSYGGSSLVPELVALGLVIGFARLEPSAAAALRQRRQARRGEPGRPAARSAVNAGARPRPRS
ncbi:putative lipid II flippase FtsW [Nocardioides pocheonensis]|uniref:putative lipid II flippase FtsW n=1 Tax=Nocardioides pocheonensis TaxID=661485 RepID=UPI001FEB612A|nr:putative lipid II flippase FtsW [Nocardioides pocheonensis]